MYNKNAALTVSLKKEYRVVGEMWNHILYWKKLKYETSYGLRYEHTEIRALLNQGKCRPRRRYIFCSCTSNGHAVALLFHRGDIVVPS